MTFDPNLILSSKIAIDGNPEFTKQKHPAITDYTRRGMQNL